MKLQNINLRVFAEDWKYLRSTFHIGGASKVIRSIVHAFVIRHKATLEAELKELNHAAELKELNYDNDLR